MRTHTNHRNETTTPFSFFLLLLLLLLWTADVNTRSIENDTARMLVKQYISLGDYVVDTAGGYLKQYPEYFPPAKK
jgi:hypothetical protein